MEVGDPQETSLPHQEMKPLDPLQKQERNVLQIMQKRSSLP